MPACALGALGVYPITGGAGGVHKLGCRLYWRCEGEGWVADHYQLQAIGGLGHQLLLGGVVECCQVGQVKGVIWRELFQNNPLPWDGFSDGACSIVCTLFLTD